MQAADQTSVEARLTAAKTSFERNEVATAEILLRSVLSNAPTREDAAMLLARVLQSQGRLQGAAEILLALCQINDFKPELSLRCAEFARQCDRHAVALQICQGALTHGSVSPDLLMLTGNLAREAGGFEAARARYSAALNSGVDLERHHVFGALANTRRYTDAADAEIAQFAAHFSDTRYSSRSCASAGFALAKAKDDLKDYMSASAVLCEANAMVHAVWPWDADAWRQFVTRRQREEVASADSAIDEDFVPVFIVGMPRTGTTLTATLLARASGARDRGELRTLRFIADHLISGGHLGNPAALAEAADLYRKLAVQDDAPVKWYIDQDPLNFRYLHIAAAMFPQAGIIHLRRDRRDTALSLWSQDFAHADLAFAYDFDDIATFAAGHDVLMRHWKQSLGIPILELDYEVLVADPEAVMAELCRFIGVPMPVTGAAGAEAPVQSASVWQARQPVYATSVGRWRHYAPYLPGHFERFS